MDKDGTSDVTLETVHYGELDNAAAPLFEKVIAASLWKTTPNLTREDREQIDRILYNQYKRTPDVNESKMSAVLTAQRYDELVEEHRVVFPDDEIARLERPHDKARIIQSAKVGARKIETPKILAQLSKLNFHVLRISNPKKAFIIGSNAVWKEKDDQNRISYWLPLSSEVQIGLLPYGQKESFSSIFDGNQIRRINERVASQSAEIAGSSCELIESLKVHCLRNP